MLTLTLRMENKVRKPLDLAPSEANNQGKNINLVLTMLLRRSDDKLMRLDDPSESDLSSRIFNADYDGSASAPQDYFSILTAVPPRAEVERPEFEVEGAQGEFTWRAELIGTPPSHLELVFGQRTNVCAPYDTEWQDTPISTYALEETLRGQGTGMRGNFTYWVDL